MTVVNVRHEKDTNTKRWWTVHAFLIVHLSGQHQARQQPSIYTVVGHILTLL
jgi:hypothetical protein